MKVIKTKLNYSHSYIVLDINLLKIDCVAPFDIYIKKDDDLVIIIEAGTLISESLYTKLKHHKNLYISKKDEDKQILSCESLKHYIRHNRDNPQKRVMLLYKISEQLFDMYATNKENMIHLECVELIIKSIIYLIKYDEKFLKSTMPYFENDHVLYSHSLHVAMYALFLANMLKFNDDDLLKIGVAALLHDVGLKK